MRDEVPIDPIDWEKNILLNKNGIIYNIHYGTYLYLTYFVNS